MTAARSSLSPSQQAQTLRELADRIERGVDAVTPELAALIAAVVEDAKVDAAADEVMAAHASILAALAK